MRKIQVGSNKVYFGNCLDQRISVNLNNSLDSVLLEGCSYAADGKMLTLPAASFAVGPYKGKGVFGSDLDGTYNTIQVFYEQLSTSAVFNVNTEKLSGQDLYFYVQINNMTGTDQNGCTTGITIKLGQIVKMRFPR